MQLGIVAFDGHFEQIAVGEGAATSSNDYKQTNGQKKILLHPPRDNGKLATMLVARLATKPADSLQVCS
jgi:hypothetical protein